MNRDIKEVVIYLSIILSSWLLPLLSAPLFILAIPERIGRLDFIIFLLIAFALSVLAAIINIAITIYAIIKAKGKFLRTFFDNINYTIVIFFLIACSFLIYKFLDFSHIYDSVIYALCEISAFIIFCIAMFVRNIKKTIFYGIIVIAFYLIAPLLLNYTGFLGVIIYHNIIINFIFISLPILCSKLYKFIKLKMQKN